MTSPKKLKSADCECENFEQTDHVQEKMPLLSDEILCMIIENLPVYMWNEVELTSKQFYHVVQLAYCRIHTLDVHDFFPALYRNKGVMARMNIPRTADFSEKLANFLSSIVVGKCSTLRNISGLQCLSNVLTSEQFSLLTKVNTLRNVSFANCVLNVNDLADFLLNIDCLTSLDLSKCTLNTIYHDADLEARLGLGFSKHQNLESLSLVNVENFEGSFLNSINSVSLKVIGLKNVGFRSQLIYDFLRRCKNVENLHLLFDFMTNDGLTTNGCGVDVSVVQCLPELRFLHCLSIENCRWNPTGPIPLLHNISLSLGKCRNLRQLICNAHNYKCDVQELILSVVVGCPDLEVFDVHAGAATLDGAFSSLMHLHKLRKLSLSVFKGSLSDQVVESLTGFAHLESISLLCCKFSAAALAKLSDIKQLKEIHISGGMVTDDILIGWSQNIGNRLVSLKLPVCKLITDRSIVDLAKNCPNIQELDISMSQITDLSIENLAAFCSKLECVNLNQYGIYYAHQNLSMIVEMSCLSKAAIINLLNSCLYLTKLNVDQSLFQQIISSEEFIRHKFRVQLSDIFN